MALAKLKTTPPRIVTRDEPEARTPERDPNVIYTRDGRPVDLGRIRDQSNDYSNLAAMGIHPPQNWTYEWRTREIKGAPYTQGMVEDSERGWTPVPAGRHPGKIMPLGTPADAPIIHGSSMLMERDERLTAMARIYERKAGQEQLQISRSMSGLMQRAAPNAGAITDFDVAGARGATGVKIERQPRFNDSKYTLEE